jgi:hypothetical protein
VVKLSQSSPAGGERSGGCEVEFEDGERREAGDFGASSVADAERAISDPHVIYHTCFSWLEIQVSFSPASGKNSVTGSIIYGQQIFKYLI